MHMQGVLQALENSVPPEVTHYHLGLHPGARWWLKTAVAKQDDHLQLMKVWQVIQQAHPKLVKITPHCFDWHQNLIPSACTIWIQQGRDVDVQIQGQDFTYHVVSSDVTFNAWGSQFRSWLRSKHNKQMKESDPDTWHKCDQIAQLLRGWCTESQAQIRRQMLKVVTDAQDSSPATDSHKLDSN